jgi:PadR family transcriptional regulator PadR
MERSMSRSEFLGEFEQVVLLTVARLGEGAYGMAIRQEIEDRARRRVAIGSVYAALDRMERKGYVSSEVGDPTPVRGGRAKRFYTLRPPGAEVLRRSHELLEGLWDGLDLDAEELT